MPLIHQLPNSAQVGVVDELAVVSPFLDPALLALSALTKRFRPSSSTLGLTRGAMGNAENVNAWASVPDRTVRALASQRYFHGKLIQWRIGQAHHVLVGSANATRAALLASTSQSGNCELGVLDELSDSLVPELADDPLAGDALAEQLLEPTNDGQALARPRLLRILMDNESTSVWLVSTDDAALDGAVLLVGADRHALSDAHDHRSTGDTLVVRRAATWVGAGVSCIVELVDGTRLGPVAVTDRAQVEQRPGLGSPLDDNSLRAVLANTGLTRRLLEALERLALLRPEQRDISAGSITPGLRTGWRARAELSVGPALVAFALGRRAAPPDRQDAAVEQSDEESSPPESSLATTHEGADERPDQDSESDPWGEAETDIQPDDDADDHGDPIVLLESDQPTARHLARRIDQRCTELDNWGTPAIAALLQVALIVAAAGGWEEQDWVPATGALLHRLAPDPAWSGDVEAVRQAVALVGLAVLSTAIHDEQSAGRPTEHIRALLESCRQTVALDPTTIDPTIVADVATGLSARFGILVTAESINDAAEWLTTASPLSRRIEDLQLDLSTATLRLETPSLIEATTNGQEWALAMQILDGCKDLAPVSARVHGSGRTLLVAYWPSKRLVVQDTRSATGSGAIYQIAVAPGAHVRSLPPRCLRRWRGPMPPELHEELLGAGLLRAPSFGHVGSS